MGRLVVVLLVLVSFTTTGVALQGGQLDEVFGDSNSVEVEGMEIYTEVEDPNISVVTIDDYREIQITESPGSYFIPTQNRQSRDVLAGGSTGETYSSGGTQYVHIEVNDTQTIQVFGQIEYEEVTNENRVIVELNFTDINKTTQTDVGSWDSEVRVEESQRNTTSIQIVEETSSNVSFEIENTVNESTGVYLPRDPILETMNLKSTERVALFLDGQRVPYVESQSDGQEWLGYTIDEFSTRTLTFKKQAIVGGTTSASNPWFFGIATGLLVIFLIYHWYQKNDIEYI